MRRISVRYVREGGTWWGESADVPGLSVTAGNLDELREQMRGAVSFALDDEPFEIVEPMQGAQVVTRT